MKIQKKFQTKSESLITKFFLFFSIIIFIHSVLDDGVTILFDFFTLVIEYLFFCLRITAKETLFICNCLFNSFFILRINLSFEFFRVNHCTFNRVNVRIKFLSGINSFHCKFISFGILFRLS